MDLIISAQSASISWQHSTEIANHRNRTSSHQTPHPTGSPSISHPESEDAIKRTNKNPPPGSALVNHAATQHKNMHACYLINLYFNFNLHFIFIFIFIFHLSSIYTINPPTHIHLFTILIVINELLPYIPPPLSLVRTTPLLISTWSSEQSK
ncbi:hypothetical protein EYC84_005796 [Monilinia fructicola]|uniref:Uncharacterized protein n=1 Tax=Monilinia fructicola TaxID=38448 RepID=A0A5M9K678_MONFR|nr:hypothetical protein EYC84_005796 [Monilinia fructicola]